MIEAVYTAAQLEITDAVAEQQGAAVEVSVALDASSRLSRVRALIQLGVVRAVRVVLAGEGLEYALVVITVDAI